MRHGNGRRSREFQRRADGGAADAPRQLRPLPHGRHGGSALGAAAAGTREKFLPVTRHALIDRLTAANLWPNGDAVQARRFLRYLDYWRRHSYAVKLLDLEQTYEPFSPDSDLLKTRTFSAEERAIMQKRLVRQMAELLEQGNFTRVDPSNVHFILTKDSAYGLDLQVDLEAFEEILIYYRGATTITERRRDVGRPTCAGRR